MPLFYYVLYSEIFFIIIIIFLWLSCQTLRYIIQFFLKIDLILWDKFSCNFKYIFINEIGFIKKIVLVVGQINKK